MSCFPLSPLQRAPSRGALRGHSATERKVRSMLTHYKQRCLLQQGSETHHFAALYSGQELEAWVP